LEVAARDDVHLDRWRGAELLNPRSLVWRQPLGVFCERDQHESAVTQEGVLREAVWVPVTGQPGEARPMVQPPERVGCVADEPVYI
jgi:hypothetical protein